MVSSADRADDHVEEERVVVGDDDPEARAVVAPLLNRRVDAAGQANEAEDAVGIASSGRRIDSASSTAHADSVTIRTGTIVAKSVLVTMSAGPHVRGSRGAGCRR